MVTGDVTTSPKSYGVPSSTEVESGAMVQPSVTRAWRRPSAMAWIGAGSTPRTDPSAIAASGMGVGLPTRLAGSVAYSGAPTASVPSKVVTPGGTPTLSATCRSSSASSASARAAIAASTSSWLISGDSVWEPPDVASSLVTWSSRSFSPSGTTVIELLPTLLSGPGLTASIATVLVDGTTVNGNWRRAGGRLTSARVSYRSPDSVRTIEPASMRLDEPVSKFEKVTFPVPVVSVILTPVAATVSTAWSVNGTRWAGMTRAAGSGLGASRRASTLNATGPMGSDRGASTIDADGSSSSASRPAAAVSTTSASASPIARPGRMGGRGGPTTGTRWERLRGRSSTLVRVSSSMLRPPTGAFADPGAPMDSDPNTVAAVSSPAFAWVPFPAPNAAPDAAPPTPSAPIPDRRPSKAATEPCTASPAAVA